MALEEIRVLSPTAILGYGFPLASFEAGLERDPHVIAVDAGSTDPGPFYLGSGQSFTQRSAVKRDLHYLVAAALERNIPLIIGTAGGSGAMAHVDWNLSIVEEVLRELGRTASIAVIYSDIKRDLAVEKLKKGEIQPLGPVDQLTEEDIRTSANLVAQMGLEPIMAARAGRRSSWQAGPMTQPYCRSPILKVLIQV